MMIRIATEKRLPFALPEESPGSPRCAGREPSGD